MLVQFDFGTELSFSPYCLIILDDSRNYALIVVQ